MTTPLSLETARVEALARQIRPELERVGEVLAWAADLDDVDRWRKAARRAGRLIGSRVRTFVSADGRAVWAVALDHEHDLAALRAAMERITAQLRPPTGQRRP